MVEVYKRHDFEICLSGHSEPQTKEVIDYLEVALAEMRDKNE